MEKRILTIQDASCVGQCSLTVALPIISACGIECSVLPSALLSTHTAGFKGFTVLDLTEEFPKIISHWEKEKISFDAVYTGYILKSQIEYINEICEKFNKGPKIIDPVMADHGKFYYGFDKEFAKEMAKLCFGADVIIPNITEAHFLLDLDCVLEGYSKDYIEDLIKKLKEKLNVKCVLLTGVSFEKDKLGICVYENDTFNYYFSNRVIRDFHGTGDIYSSSFVGAYIQGFSSFEASKIAVDFTVSSMNNTLEYADSHSYGVFFEKSLKNLANKVNK